MSFDEFAPVGTAVQRTDALPAHSKRCPRCGELLFDDMDVCFGCLYDFTREPYRLPEGMIESVSVETDPDTPEELSCDPIVHAPTVPADGTLADRPHGALPFAPDRHPVRKIVLDTAELGVGLPLPCRGLSVGSAPDNDIVLRAKGVADHHLVLIPRPCDVVALGLVDGAFESAGNPSEHDCAFLREDEGIALGNLNFRVGSW